MILSYLSSSYPEGLLFIGPVLIRYRLLYIPFWLKVSLDTLTLCTVLVELARTD